MATVASGGDSPKDGMMEPSMENYAPDYEENMVMDLMRVMMMEGVDGHEGVKRIKGHMMTTDGIGVKGLTSVGGPVEIRCAVNEYIGQALMKCGEVLMVLMMANGDSDMDIAEIIILMRRREVHQSYG